MLWNSSPRQSLSREVSSRVLREEDGPLRTRGPSDTRRLAPVARSRTIRAAAESTTRWYTPIVCLESEPTLPDHFTKVVVVC
jgi:hypothetical protein